MDVFQNSPVLEMFTWGTINLANLWLNGSLPETPAYSIMTNAGCSRNYPIKQVYTLTGFIK